MPRAKKNETNNEDAKYEAIEDFTDWEDGDKIYITGDRYPKPANKIIPEERLKALLSSKNNQKRPVIKKI